MPTARRPGGAGSKTVERRPFEPIGNGLVVPRGTRHTTGDKMPRGRSITNAKIPSLDGLRAVSIAVVFIDTLDSPHQRYHRRHDFLLSQRVLDNNSAPQGTSPIRRVKPPDFDLRRVFRILPVMYLVLGGAMLVDIAARGPSIIDERPMVSKRRETLGKTAPSVFTYLGTNVGPRQV